MISVLTLTYKRKKFLEEAIYSFLQQKTSFSKEMVIINDDQTVDYVYDHPEIKIHNVKTRFSSIGKKLEYGYKLCTHDFVYRLDDDDLLADLGLNLAAQEIIQHPGYELYRSKHHYGSVDNYFKGLGGGVNTGNIYTKKYLDRIVIPDASFAEDTEITMTNNPSCHEAESVTMIYRWGMNTYHASAVYNDYNKTDSEKQERILSFNNTQFMTGIVPITPFFEKNYYEEIRHSMLVPNSVPKTSISDESLYKNFCREAATNEEVFSVFRNCNPTYNQILEHVDYNTGLQYIRWMQNNTVIDERLVEIAHLNDALGSPKKKLFTEPFLEISPSTLRYTKVLKEIEQLFGSLDNKHIVEIGAGYGGQCKLICSYFTPASYTIVDLPEAMQLSSRYLRDILHVPLFFKHQTDIFADSYDFVISNYAFSECTKDVQEHYLKHIIQKTTSGYITFNNISHHFNVDSISKKSFKNIIICNEIPETPVTGDNCVLYW